MVKEADYTYRTDRVAIVTGGSYGIGREVARKLASHSYAIVINYARDQSAAEAAVEEILAANGTAIAVRGDVADELDVERLFAEASEAFGGVDVVVHAAGQGLAGPAADAAKQPDAYGTFLVNQEAVRQLRNGGSIVNLSASGAVGTLSADAASLSADAASSPSNDAAAGMSPTLARELIGRDVTINTVVPGLGPPATPAEIAGVVVFLVSPDGHSVNRQVLRADGRTV